MPPLALLAGGLATRLGAITAHTPKSLVEVVGEPFIAHQLRLLTSQCITDVVLCCGHFGSIVEGFVGDGSRFGLRVRYSHDGPIPLGTGGAIRKALPLLGDSFWVMYGDSYLTLDFRAVLDAFEHSGQIGLMTVFRNDDCWDASNVEFADGRVVRYAKGSRESSEGQLRHIDYGLSLYRAEAFERWPDRAPFDLSALQSRLAAGNQLAGFEVNHRFYEIGSPSGLRETDAFLLSQNSSIASAPAGASL